MCLFFKKSRMNLRALMLIIEWVGYNFVKYVIFHYFIIVNRLLREINLDPYVLEMYSGRFVVGLDVDEKG